MEPLIQEVRSLVSQRPLPVSGHRIVCAEQNGFYLVGGWNPTINDGTEDFDDHYVRTIWKYNAALNEWTQLRSRCTPKALASHNLVYLNEKQLFVFGGSLSHQHIAGMDTNLHVYNLETEEWGKLNSTGDKPPRDLGHWFGCALFHHRRGQTIYVACPCKHANTMLIYSLDMVTLEWTHLTEEITGPSPPAAVRGEIVVDNGKLYVLGGAADFHEPAVCYFDRIPTFDLRSKRWEVSITQPASSTLLGEGADYPEARSCFGAVLHENVVYISGGFNRRNGHGTSVIMMRGIWRLDLRTLQWRLFTWRFPAVWFHSVSVSPDGCMFAFSGCGSLDYNTDCRSDNVIKVWLSVRSLQELAWHSLLSKHRDFLQCADANSLFAAGIPRSYIDRLKF